MKKNKEEEQIEVLDFDADSKDEKELSNQIEEYEKRPNIFIRLKENFENLSNKQKTIIIVSAILVLMIIISVVLYLIVGRNAKDTSKKQIIIAKDNYRYEDGTLYFVVNNKDIGSYECKNKDKNLCYVAYETNDDDFDETKYENNDNDKIRSKIYKNKYVLVFDNKNKKDEELTLYDIKSKKDLGKYKGIKTYNLENKNLVFLKNDDEKYGLVEFSSDKMKTKLKFNYDYLGMITENKDLSEGKIVAKQDEGYFLIDLKGNNITKTLTGKIKNYNNNYVKTMDATKKYILYDYQGNKIVDQLKYIDLLDDYYLAIDDNNKLRVFGYDNTKYLEDGITLYNNDYVKTIVKRKVDEETKYSYTYELQDKTLTINVYNNGNVETTNLNLNDGLVSKNLKYINYFNGSIYFYSDEAKTTLINSYKCNNANNLQDEKSTLDICKLASDTAENDNETNEVRTGATIVPILNNRFVFIQDGQLVNLVDLVSEKVIGTYQNIDSLSDATKTEIYPLATSASYIIAKNKNNKYGVLKINESSATALYNFEYDKIEHLKNYFLAKKDNKTFLLDYNGNKVTKEFDGQIRNYNGNYVKILNKNKYYIYDFNGKLIFEDGYKYVELYDDLVALVDDSNQLTIKDYKNNILINEILKLSSDTYYNAKEGYATAFSIKKENNKLTITAATSQNTKKEKTKDFVYDLTTKKRIN